MLALSLFDSCCTGLLLVIQELLLNAPAQLLCWQPLPSANKHAGVQALQQAASAWRPAAPNAAGVHELLASFFARSTKAFTLWLARSAPAEMRCGRAIFLAPCL